MLAVVIVLYVVTCTRMRWGRGFSFWANDVSPHNQNQYFMLGNRVLFPSIKFIPGLILPWVRPSSWCVEESRVSTVAGEYLNEAVSLAPVGSSGQHVWPWISCLWTELGNSPALLPKFCLFTWCYLLSVVFWNTETLSWTFFTFLRLHFVFLASDTHNKTLKIELLYFFSAFTRFA